MQIVRLTETDTEFWQRAIDVTLRGTIVSTSSTERLVGTTGLTPYISVKHEVKGLTKSAALEFGKKYTY